MIAHEAPGPLLSIVIVNYNTRELLKNALESIQRQFQAIAYEIIVVDNVSRDGSCEMIENEFPTVLLIKNEVNAGVVVGNNQGINVAHGRYVLLMNSDVVIRTDNIIELLGHFDTDNSIGLIGPRIYFGDGSIQTSAMVFTNLTILVARNLRIKRLLGNSDAVKQWVGSKLGGVLGKTGRGYLTVYRNRGQIEQVDWMTSAFLVIKREVFDDIGQWDEDYFMYCDEEDFTLRAHRSGWKAIYYPPFEITHFQGSSGRGNPKVVGEQHRSELMFCIKHLPASHVIVVRCLMAVIFGLRGLVERDRPYRAIYRQVFRYAVGRFQYIRSHGVIN